MIDISGLKLTQLYLSQKKLDAILTWFDESMSNFDPLPVRDFLNNGNLHLTDGHSRAFVAWAKGISQIPCVYDEDEIVTCEIGQVQYEKDIEWCERFGLNDISTLADRILSEVDYKNLWQDRCGKMYDLETGLLDGKIDRDKFEKIKLDMQKEGLFIYGSSEDFSIVYYENKFGELFEEKIDVK